MEESPLQKWNRLNKENAEHSIVSVMFASVVSKSPEIDKFSTWLLVGTGGTATLLISNIKDIQNALSPLGFKIGLSLLVASGLMGILARCVNVFFQAGGDQQSKLIEQIQPFLDKHAEDEKKILELAKAQELTLETKIEVDRILKEYMKPFPSWTRWMFFLFVRKQKDNTQVGHLLPVKAFIWQTNLAFLQALLFISFFIAALYFA